MSRVGVLYVQRGYPRSDVWGYPLLCYDACSVTYTPPKQNDRETPVKILPSRNYHCGKYVLF